MTPEAILAAARARGWRIATAESCTGGMVAAALTDIAGSSDVFERGFITYSNLAKRQMIGVRTASLTDFGAVSEEVAREMAEGALVASDTHLAVSVTGIAGPTGATPTKPVGLVYLGVADRVGVRVERHVWSGDRSANKRESAAAVLRLLLATLG